MVPKDSFVGEDKVFGEMLCTSPSTKDLKAPLYKPPRNIISNPV